MAGRVNERKRRKKKKRKRRGNERALKSDGIKQNQMNLRAAAQIKKK